jgi:hypothetical protein
LPTLIESVCAPTFHRAAASDEKSASFRAIAANADASFRFLGSEEKFAMLLEGAVIGGKVVLDAPAPRPMERTRSDRLLTE